MNLEHVHMRRLWFGLGLSVCFSVNCVYAQQVADPQLAAAALVRAQGLLRQIAQEKMQLESENATLTADLAKAKLHLRQSESRLDDAANELKASEHLRTLDNNTLAHLRGRLEKATARLQEFVEKFKAASKTLAVTEAERQRLVAELAASAAEVQDAERKNIALYAANVELLALYADKSAFDALLQREPATGLKNVRIETILEEYEFKMYDEVRTANLEKARALSAE
jgi:chromosome segregation ATPase